jgi:hypothetical protein
MVLKDTALKENNSVPRPQKTKKKQKQKKQKKHIRQGPSNKTLGRPMAASQRQIFGGSPEKIHRGWKLGLRREWAAISKWLEWAGAGGCGVRLWGLCVSWGCDVRLWAAT